MQRRYPEALAAHEEARKRFKELSEPSTVAESWHLTGMVHEAARQPEAALDAYRNSLAISVPLGILALQAVTLAQLGNLHNEVLNRQEEAKDFYRQAVEKFVEIGDVAKEGRTRANLGNVMFKLRRMEDARQEITLAIECGKNFGHSSSPWNTWAILAEIEKVLGNHSASADAKRKAITCYLAYRRDGGENHDVPGRFVLDVIKALRAGEAAELEEFFRELFSHPNIPGPQRAFATAVRAIVAGSRDSALADAPDLDFKMAAEILFLIETLENPR